LQNPARLPECAPYPGNYLTLGDRKIDRRRRLWSSRVGIATALIAGTLFSWQGATAAESGQNLVARGRQLFFQETFSGNGRTCGTCHPAENNYTLDAAYIARLPDRHPLFVAEFNPELKEGFENPRLMREFGLILENLDGFDDLENRFVMRAVPHTLALATSVDSPDGPRTGWSGDGAPGDGSLRAFATGAVIQHFTRSLGRVPDADFRLPTDGELDALEAFMLSLGRRQELKLPLPLRGAMARRGQEIFLDNGLGKCNLCHVNAGANADFGAGSLGNASFDTGVEDLPESPAALTGERVPRDDGFGTPGNGLFNTPPLVEAADTPPFFHNNAVRTLEGAVAFYNSEAFNNSPAGRALASADPKGIGIRLETGQVEAVAAFLRVINALENIRQGRELMQSALDAGLFGFAQNPARLGQAVEETEDAIRVLSEAGLHPRAVNHLRTSLYFTRLAGFLFLLSDPFTRVALAELDRARAELIEDRRAPTRVVYWRGK
jgi:cytochrome c553